MKTRKVTSIFFRILVFTALVIALALGAISSAKATSISSIIAWGDNYYGQLSIPASLTDIIAISAGGTHNLALKSDGTVVGWGYNADGETDVPAGLAGVVAIAAGRFHSLALKSDGTVVGWGYNYYGETSAPASLMDAVAIAAGEHTSLALKRNGAVVAWGDNRYGQLSVPPDLADVVAIASSTYHSLALKSDGTVVAWGWDLHGENSVPPGLADVVAIASGTFHNLALKSDGTVVAWGDNRYGQTIVPSGLTGVTAIAAGGYHSLALKGDGTVVAWGINGSVLNVPAGLTDVDAISAGLNHSLALVLLNSAPTANPGGPYLGTVNTAIQFDGSLSPDPENEPLTYAWDFGDGSAGADAMQAHTYTDSGLYNVCLTVNDGSLNSDPACTLAVVYDPSNGFVTGGGWIDSPAGAYKADESLSGKATFGFVSKYQKGAPVPNGNTAFQFQVGGFEFDSTAYEWLVVNQSGTNAQFKGTGMVNGGLDPNGNVYQFMLWAGDGSPDTFRIRIWWEDASGERDVYDNGVAQAIGGGSIVIHNK